MIKYLEISFYPQKKSLKCEGGYEEDKREHC